MQLIAIEPSQFRTCSGGVTHLPTGFCLSWACSVGPCRTLLEQVGRAGEDLDNGNVYPVLVLRQVAMQLLFDAAGRSLPARRPTVRPALSKGVAGHCHCTVGRSAPSPEHGRRRVKPQTD